MDTNTTAMPPIAPQSVPVPLKRLSPFRFLIPALGTVFLTVAIELLYTRGILPACSELRCLLPMLALYAVRLVVIPVGFAFIGARLGARLSSRARVTEGLTWFAIAFTLMLAVMMWATSWPTVKQDSRQFVISSFQECVEAGFPVMESYPRRCLDFVEEVADGTTAPVPSSSGEAVMCTADAFQCPDGTWVGRTGPRCEFVCP